MSDVVKILDKGGSIKIVQGPEKEDPTYIVYYQKTDSDGNSLEVSVKEGSLLLTRQGDEEPLEEFTAVNEFKQFIDTNENDSWEEITDHLTTIIGNIPTPIDGNEGQVKINTGNGLKPTYTWGGGIPAGTSQQITYAAPLGLSSDPVTQWPENIESPEDADIYDFGNGTFIENTILGQVNIWRIICEFSGKATNIAAGVEIIIENTLSGFLEETVVTLPRTAASGSFVAILITIADQASLPSPLGTGQGYEISLNSTDDLTVVVDSITRANYQKNVR